MDNQQGQDPNQPMPTTPADDQNMPANEQPAAEQPTTEMPSGDQPAGQ